MITILNPLRRANLGNSEIRFEDDLNLHHSLGLYFFIGR